MYIWDEEKNIKLKRTRQIGFEEVVYTIEKGQLKDEVENPRSDKYPGQTLLIVEIRNYCYVVPALKQGSDIILKTIYPSRKATKIYCPEGRRQNER